MDVPTNSYMNKFHAPTTVSPKAKISFHLSCHFVDERNEWTNAIPTAKAELMDLWKDAAAAAQRRHSDI